MNFKHGELYVYDGPSQTFDMYVGDIYQLENAFRRCRDEEIICFVSFYGKKVGVTLTKYAYTGGTNTEFQVKGEGESVEQAFTHAFNNFPKNPLDGASKWKSDRLAKPEPVTEGEFTETAPDAS